VETVTVTFLFTDIEGSTRRWESDPAAMAAALSQHDRLLREAIAAHGGVVFKHTGDGMCATFSAAPPALAAALAAQQTLLSADWPVDGPLRARMAVHAGSAEHREGDFFGPTLNRTARLLSCGHGGQVLVSRAAAEMALDDLPTGVALRDLGEHRLADIIRAERIFQLTHHSLPEEFPALRTVGAQGHNLPLRLSSFVGRERELADICERLDASRLVTLTGVGGAGKTRLALEVAARRLPLHPDGVFVVELAPLRDTALVAETVVSALGLLVDGPGSPLDRLCEYVANRRLLIVLDNCEHVIDAAADVAGVILERSEGPVLLATSREPLGIAGETVWRVPSLAMVDAVELLCERARSADPRFTPSAANTPALEEICRRLDGIPLALELAAARLHVLSPEEVAARLHDRFRVLTGGSRTAVDRHRTLRAAVDWGYELLPEDERALLRRLAVFAGGFTIDAAEAVGPDPSGLVKRSDVLDRLAALVDRSWVGVEAAEGGTRYRLSQTIRDYAAEKLAESGDADDARRRHRDFFVELVTGEEQLLFAPTPTWFSRIAADYDNIRDAFDWSCSMGDADASLRLATDLISYWGYAGQPEGSDWIERAMALRPDAQGPDLARTLAYLGAHLQQQRAEPEIGIERAREALELAVRYDDVQSAALARLVLGMQLLEEDVEGSAGLIGEALAAFRAVGAADGVAWCEFQLGWVALPRDPKAAAGCFDRMTEIGRAFDNDCILAHGLAALGTLAARAGDAQRAAALAEESIERAQRLGRQSLVMALVRATESSLLSGANDRAASLLREALLVLRDLGTRAWVGEALELAAALAAESGRPAEATRLRDAAGRIHERLSGSLAGDHDALLFAITAVDAQRG
jgi:predicted ATPase/class 3 adenylate cyclase